MRDFKDKGVIITGASRGIGKRLAIGFAASGARVGLISRTQRDLDAAALEIAQAGGHADSAAADVRDYGRVHHAIEGLKRKLHTVDLLIAAAGVQGPIGAFAESAAELWTEVIQTNLIGVMNVIRAVLPYMMKQRSGKIIVIGGGGGASSRPNFAPYAVSKTAVVRLVETVAEEVRDSNIQINCFSPGGSYTSMTDEILEAGDRAGAHEIQQAEHIRLTGGVAADKQIQFAKFLASDRSNHISGKMIHVTDNLKQIEHANMTADLYTLRRLKS